MPAGLPTARSLSASAVRIGRLRRWSFAALRANQFRAAFLARIDDVLDLQVRREDLDRPKGKVADPALWARNDRGGKRGGPKTHASLVGHSLPNNASARARSIELWANSGARAFSASLRHVPMKLARVGTLHLSPRPSRMFPTWANYYYCRSGDPPTSTRGEVKTAASVSSERAAGLRAHSAALSIGDPVRNCS